MEIEDARFVAESFGMQIAFDKNLNLWGIMINDIVCYVTTQELEEFSLSDFAQEIKLMLSFYVSVYGTKPKVVYH